MKVRSDKVKVRGETETTFTYQEHPPSVVIVPVTDDGRIVLIRQFRYTVDAWTLEVPAGKTDDTGDMPMEDVARKELKEEIGGTCRDLRHVGGFYSSPGVSTEECHVFLATGVEMNQAPEREPTETVETTPMSIAEAYDAARQGRVTTGPSALALFLCEQYVRSFSAWDVMWARAFPAVSLTSRNSRRRAAFTSASRSSPSSRAICSDRPNFTV